MAMTPSRRTTSAALLTFCGLSMGFDAADVRDVATTVKDVAGMIGQTRQAADLVTKVSTDLGRQAADLRSAVDRFIETTQRFAA